MQWVKQLAARPGNTIITTARNPTAAEELKLIGSNVTVLALDTADESSINSFVDEIASTVQHLDVRKREKGEVLAECWHPKI